MADANQVTPVPEGTGKAEDSANQHQGNDKAKLYEESVVKEIIAQRDTLKERIRKIEADTQVEAKKREEDSLKAKNDYDGLVKLHLSEHEKAINAAKSLIINNYLTTMATKHGLNDPADIALFTPQLELDTEFSVKNGAEVEKAFEDFKKKKPYLFKSDSKTVPGTDNRQISKPDADSTIPQSRAQAIDEIGKSMLEGYRGRYS